MPKNKKRNTGITLIALIITIIVLLILAGIAISALTSNNSVLKQAGSAKKETVESEEAEKVSIAVMDAATNASKTVSGELTTEFVKNAIKGQFGEDAVSKVKGDGPWIYEGEYRRYFINKTGKIEESNATIAKDNTGKEYSLPYGATYKEGNIDTGLVITYKGSEFVWIPVNSKLEVLGKNGVSTGKKMAKLYTLDENTVDSKGKTKYEGILYNFSGSGTEVTSMEKNATGYGQATTSYREPALLSTNDTNSSYYNTILGYDSSDDFGTAMQEEYDAMIESVIKYGGFYVGRYESSLEETVAASKPGIKPMSAAVSEGNTWYGLYQKQKDFTDDKDSTIAGMIWGSQYDAMLNWVIGTETDKAKVMQDTNGNHQGSSVGIVECGSYNSGSDKINNIYDLEGNIIEWTNEADFESTRVERGGDCYNRYITSKRSYLSTYRTSLNNGSRLSLYIK